VRTISTPTSRLTVRHMTPGRSHKQYYCYGCTSFVLVTLAYWQTCQRETLGIVSMHTFSVLVREYQLLSMFQIAWAMQQIAWAVRHQ
jgi:hypothetical protein